MQVLGLSVALNCIFVLLFFYTALREEPLRRSFVYRPSPGKGEVGASNRALLQAMRGWSWERLVQSLENRDLQEDGYATRDLALAVLVAWHHLDIARPLAGKRVQERRLPLSPSLEIQLYPGLGDEAFAQIQHFIAVERWPLTSRGLYAHLKEGKPVEASLLQAFFLTPEFHALEALFARSPVPLRRGTLLKMVCEGSWKILAQYAESQKGAQDFSPGRRQCLLLEYIRGGSKTAAYLMIMTDRLYAEKRLDDRQVIDILRLLTEKTQEAALFARELLEAPRADSVHQEAARCLYAYAGEILPQPFDYAMALKRFTAGRTLPGATGGT